MTCHSVLPPGRVKSSRALAALLAALLAVLTLTMAACASRTAGGPSATEPSVTADALPHATYTDTTALGTGDGAVLEGTLELRGCLVVTAADTTTVVPVFPASTTTWSAERRQLTVSSSAVEVGATVAFGGSYLTDPGDDITVPPACGKIGRYFLVSTI